MQQPPAEIPGYKKIEPTEGFEKQTRINTPNNQSFQAYMKEPSVVPGEEMAQGISPIDLARASSLQNPPTFDSLLGQVSLSNAQIEQMQNDLATPNLRFKSSQARLLESKLADAKEHISSASEKLGVPLLPETPLPQGMGPVARFLGLLTDGQNQLMAAKAQVENLKNNGENIKPTDMLLIQIKLSQAQQEIEYSSILLSKVVDIVKQMINIQI
jgi:hypothetical protein